MHKTLHGPLNWDHGPILFHYILSNQSLDYFPLSFLRVTGATAKFIIEKHWIFYSLIVMLMVSIVPSLNSSSFSIAFPSPPCRWFIAMALLVWSATELPECWWTFLMQCIDPPELKTKLGSWMSFKDWKNKKKECHQSSHLLLIPYNIKNDWRWRCLFFCKHIAIIKVQMVIV